MAVDPITRLQGADPVRPDALELPTLDAIEARWPQLEASAELAGSPDAGRSAARGRSRGHNWRSGFLGLSLAGLIVAGTAGGTLAVVTGDPLGRAEAVAISVPDGTSRIADVRADDPDGGPSWGVQLGRLAPGLACLTVGQLGPATDAGATPQLGLVGLDGTFRTSAVEGAEECAVAPQAGGIIAHGRTFVGRTPELASSVIFGMVGPDVQHVVVRYVDGASKRLKIDRDGVFVVARRGTLTQGRANLLTSVKQGQDEHGHFARTTGRSVGFGPPYRGGPSQPGVEEHPLDPTEAPR